MKPLAPDATPDEVLKLLDRDGYAVVEGLLERDRATRIREELTRILEAIPTGRNDFEGRHTKRIYVGSLWHGGGANRTDHPRLGAAIEYVASWLRPQETQLLAVRGEIVRGLPERLQELLGYNIRPPFLGYVDGRHPRRFL